MLPSPLALPSVRMIFTIWVLQSLKSDYSEELLFAERGVCPKFSTVLPSLTFLQQNRISGGAKIVKHNDFHWKKSYLEMCERKEMATNSRWKGGFFRVKKGFLRGGFITNWPHFLGSEFFAFRKVDLAVVSEKDFLF